MTLTQASEFLTTILSSGRTRERDHFLRLAVDYARIRAEWALMERALRATANADRTRAHDALITACDALAQAMGAAGEDASWRAAVGPDRKEIGDFACQAHCLLGISAR